MSSPDPLIVPVEVAAMALTDPAANMLRKQMDYGQLANMASPAPGPFSRDTPDFAADPANQGVYVLWTLPRGLRCQRRGATGDVSEFPFVPNRWLVVRLFRPAAERLSPTAPQVACWVLRGDGIGQEGGAAYADPASPGRPRPTRIGIKTPVSDASPWQEPAGARPYFLRAVAEGNPAFAAFQPFNENVFSFFDDLQHQRVGEGSVSYYLLGWYSDPSADVLAGWRADGRSPAFADVLSELNWSADVSAGQASRACVFQGSAFGIPWTPGNRTPQPTDNAHPPSVAIGSTGVDAVVAFIRAALAPTAGADLPGNLTPQQAAGLIEAFAYDLLPMLDQPGTGAMLQSQIRGHWFSSAQGGSTWTIVDAPHAPHQAGAAPEPPTPAELAAEARWLVPLNQAQAQLDELTRQLLGVQRELFALWWKQRAAGVYYTQTGSSSLPWGVSSRDDFAQPIGALADQARSLLTQIARHRAAIPAATAGQSLDDAIAAFARDKGLPSARLLKRVPRPGFWAPADPVAVISHTGHTMRLNPDGATACRWPAALVTSIKVTPGDGVDPFPVTAAQVAGLLPAVPWHNLPDIGPDLFAELFLLDPANIAQLAAAAHRTLTEAQLTGAAQSMSPPAVQQGTAAEPRAPFPWAQPWRPLYFDWRIIWYPVPFRDPGDGSANWTFNGLDYQLAAGRKQGPPGQRIEGRTFLTPQPSFQFKSRIGKFIRDYPASPVTAALQEIDNVIESVDSWDFLSQALSGLGIQLAGWNPVPTLTPEPTTLPGGGTMAELTGDQPGYPPASLLANKQRVPPPPSTFEGMRAGQFIVDRITVVDVFGQTLEIVESPAMRGSVSRTPDGRVFTPLIADGLTPGEPLSTVEPGRFVQLPPRVLQPARLNFDFPGDRTGNPVIGWLLPNHPDSSLAVYGPDGTAYGALRLGTGPQGMPDATWDAAPGSADLPSPSAGRGDLQDMLASLKALGADALRDFLQSVDESLWTVDPLGTRTDTFLSVLVGRPLAVVRATISLELQTAPWRDTAWPYTFTDPPPRLLGYQFPVRLGDLGYHHDGLIGYFTEGAYDSFNCIHLPARDAGEQPLSGYLHPIGPGNYVQAGFGPTGRGPATKLTMIVDPRASVHAQCALVPVVEAVLPDQWVSGVLANLEVTFRAGPALVGEQAGHSSAPGAPGAPGTDAGGRRPGPGAVALPRFAEERGVLTWLERDGVSGRAKSPDPAGAGPPNGWTERAVVPADSAATLPPLPPTLREGLLRLTRGVGSPASARPGPPTAR